MTNIYAVAGEHRDNPGRLLLRGEDGAFYTLAAGGRIVQVESMDEWTLDGSPVDRVVEARRADLTDPAPREHPNWFARLRGDDAPRLMFAAS